MGWFYRVFCFVYTNLAECLWIIVGIETVTMDRSHNTRIEQYLQPTGGELVQVVRDPGLRSILGKALSFPDLQTLKESQRANGAFKIEPRYLDHFLAESERLMLALASEVLPGYMKQIEGREESRSTLHLRSESAAARVAAGSGDTEAGYEGLKVLMGRLGRISTLYRNSQISDLHARVAQLVDLQKTLRMDLGVNKSHLPKEHHVLDTIAERAIPKHITTHHSPGLEPVFLHGPSLEAMLATMAVAGDYASIPGSRPELSILSGLNSTTFRLEFDPGTRRSYINGQSLDEYARHVLSGGMDQQSGALILEAKTTPIHTLNFNYTNMRDVGGLLLERIANVFHHYGGGDKSALAKLRQLNPERPHTIIADHYENRLEIDVRDLDFNSDTLNPGSFQYCARLEAYQDVGQSAIYHMIQGLTDLNSGDMQFLRNRVRTRQEERTDKELIVDLNVSTKRGEKPTGTLTLGYAERQGIEKGYKPIETITIRAHDEKIQSSFKMVNHQIH